MCNSNVDENSWVGNTCTGLDWLSGDARGDNFGETLAVDDSAGLVWVAATGVDDPDLGVGRLYGIPFGSTSIADAVMTVSGEAIANHLGTQMDFSQIWMQMGMQSCGYQLMVPIGMG